MDNNLLRMVTMKNGLFVARSGRGAFPIAWLAAMTIFLAPAARADQAAAEVVRVYQAALLDTMNKGQQLGFEGRYRAFEPVVAKAFDLAYLAQRAIGQTWSSIAEPARQRYIAAFSKYSIAQHAARFKAFGGERFEQLGTDDVGRGFVRVRTVLVTGGGERVPLDYLLGQRGGRWRIVDVFAKGAISEVSTRRADFAPVLRDRGIDALIQEIEQKTAASRS